MTIRYHATSRVVADTIIDTLTLLSPSHIYDSVGELADVVEQRWGLGERSAWDVANRDWQRIYLATTLAGAQAIAGAEVILRVEIDDDWELHTDGVESDGDCYYRDDGFGLPLLAAREV